MIKTAILTCRKIPGLLEYDRELGKRAKLRGFDCEPLIWDDDQKNIDKYDLFLFRTTWGYHRKEAEFREFVKLLAVSGKKVLNPVEIIEENMHKFYLKNLRENGIDIIPTYFATRNSELDLNQIADSLNSDKIIIKPAVSAASYNTLLIDRAKFEISPEPGNLNAGQDLLIQAFMPCIRTAGEFSTIFFNNGFHYTVNKMPVNGDYRVQRDFGGKYSLVKAPDEVVDTSRKIAENYLDRCLYVRVDGVIYQGRFLLMEVEMIEPDLYMDLKPGAIGAYIDSIVGMI